MILTISFTIQTILKFLKQCSLYDQKRIQYNSTNLLSRRIARMSAVAWPPFVTRPPSWPTSSSTPSHGTFSGSETAETLKWLDLKTTKPLEILFWWVLLVHYLLLNWISDIRISRILSSDIAQQHTKCVC